MPVTVVHQTTAVQPDSGDGKISSNAWNQQHTLTGLGTMAEANTADYYTAAAANAAFMATGSVTQYTDEMARDALGTAMTAGAGITITPNDGADTIAIASTITQYTDEQVRDVIGAALVAGANITLTVNDAGDTITIAASGGGGGGTQEVYVQQTRPTPTATPWVWWVKNAAGDAVTNLIVYDGVP